MFMGKSEKFYQLKGFVKYEKQTIYFENIKKWNIKLLLAHLAVIFELDAVYMGEI